MHQIRNALRAPLLRAALLPALLLAGCRDGGLSTGAAPAEGPLLSSTAAAGGVVVSQVYGGGGNSGATLRNDFIELYNTTDAPISLVGWSVQYASATGSSWQVTSLSGSIAPGGYYLVQQAAGAGGTADLPTPDATGTIAMAAGAGKVALVNVTAALGGTCPTTGVVDFVGFGSTANCFEGTAPTPTLSNTTAAIRKGNGAVDTGNNAADFDVGAPNPRNSGTLPPPPVEVATVTITPSTAVIVAGGTVTLAAIASGANGQPVPGISFAWSSSDTTVARVDPASGLTTGVKAGSATITAAAPNGVAGTASITINAAPPVTTTRGVVVSQVYGGGGNSGATLRNDFIELYNTTDAPISLVGWSVQYASATGSSWQVTSLSGSIAPGGYYLVQQAAGTGGTADLPTPDATGTIPMAAGAGKVALVSSTAPLSDTGCPIAAAVTDFVGFGGTANCFEGTGPAPAPSAMNAVLRKGGGATDTDDNAADFVAGAPTPRNSGYTPPPPPPVVPLVINEILEDPASAESASWGEWFEIYNYGTTPIDLQGWTIASGGQSNHVIASSVIVPAGGYAVLGRGADPTRNGGITLDYNYFTGTSTIWLDNTDWLALRSASGATVDSVRWTTRPARGVTRALRDHTSDNSDVMGPNWGYSTARFGAGDYGTPGAPNGTLTDTPPAAPNSITFSGRSPSADPALPVGFEAQIFATFRDGTGAITPTTIAWRSETPAIASVDARGVIRSLAPGTAVFRATAADGTTATYSLPMRVGEASGSASYLGNTEFGDPTDSDPSDDFIIRYEQFTTSWSPTRGTPNWVSYNLEATHFGGEDRCNCFTFDPELPAQFERYTTADYTGAGAFHGYGIDRGHLVRSADRTSSSLDNARTYYFTNIIPQAADNNQGPWAIMENHLGDRARRDGKEVYVIAGVAGSKGTVKDEGKITIPANLWKVAVIMDRDKGLSDVRSLADLEVVAVIMPNEPGIRNVDWNSYRTTVDAVEALSGYDVLSLLPDPIEIAVESGTKPPTARVNGPFSGVEGTSLSMSGAASTDPDGDALTFRWSFGDGATGAGPTVTHTYGRNGTFTVRLIVTDPLTLADTVTTTVTVGNVAPTVGALPDTTLVAGETYVARGSFGDPGADSWTATVDYGSGAEPLALTGKSFDLRHTYAVGGSYTVTVGVDDGDATGTATARVTVWTPVEATAELSKLVDALGGLGISTQSSMGEQPLPAGTIQSLQAKVSTAKARLEAGNTAAASGQLLSFISELQALVTSNRLSNARAKRPIELATRIRDSIR